MAVVDVAMHWKHQRLLAGLVLLSGVFTASIRALPMIVCNADRSQRRMAERLGHPVQALVNPNLL